jgi:predicted Zn-dependent peptidase
MKNVSPNERLTFERETLGNGITVHRKRTGLPFTMVNVRVPVGSVHSISPHPNGIAHFLEHACFLRSRRLPEKRAFDRLVGEHGGWMNAVTAPFYTDYWISMPDAMLEEALEGLFSMVFEPLLAEEDLRTERGIVGNERNARRWYPGHDECDAYLQTRWRSEAPFPLEQLFGTDDDLARMDAKAVRAFQANYATPDVRVIAVGDGSIGPLTARLRELPVTPRALREHFEPTRWVDRSYREVPFRDLSRYELRWAGIVSPKPDPLTYRRLRFILGYLTNHVHGALYLWLREEKGWVYGINVLSQLGPRSYDWMMTFPLTAYEQVATVRAELMGRVERALADEDAISREVDRLQYASCYWFETAESVFDASRDFLADWGRILTVEDLLGLLESCRDAQALRELFHAHLSDQATGMILTHPESHAGTAVAGPELTETEPQPAYPTQESHEGEAS